MLKIIFNILVQDMYVHQIKKPHWKLIMEHEIGMFLLVVPNFLGIQIINNLAQFSEELFSQKLSFFVTGNSYVKIHV